MILKHSIYFFSLLILLYSGLSNANPLLGENAEPASENEFPFFVILSRSSDITSRDDYFCGGTLITKRHVLTAHHCIDEDIFNITFIVNAAATYKAHSWVTYDDWAIGENMLLAETDNDIAVIILSDDVKDVVPAVISKLKYQRVIGRRVVTIGWGSINEADDLYPDTLMKASMKVLNYKDYKRNSIAVFGRMIRYSFNFYYTSANPTVALGCGDSGGPLMLESNKELIGVNTDVCRPQLLATNPPLMSRHMNLDFYRKFIEDAIKK